MKSTLILLLVAIAALVSADGEVPDWLPICSKKNAKIMSNCIRDVIIGMRPKLKEGIPEYGVTSINLLFLDKLVMNLGNGISAVGTNLEISGGGDYVIGKLAADVSANTYTFDFTIPKATVTGNYEINATIASIPLNGKGPIIVEAKDVYFQAILYGKIIPHDQTNYYYFPKLELKMKITEDNFQMEFKDGVPHFRDTINKVVNEEKSLIIDNLASPIEKVVSEHIVTAANNVVKNIPYKSLLRD